MAEKDNGRESALADAADTLDGIFLDAREEFSHPLDAGHLDVLRARLDSVSEVLDQLRANRESRDHHAAELLAAHDEGTLDRAVMPDHSRAVLAGAIAERNGARS
jgi:hypothetical protein